MNERIKELAESSKLYDCLFCGEGNIEKFAKLIIQECVDVASTSVNNEEPYEAWYLIQKHFEIN